jgi:DNA polymerase
MERSKEKALREIYARYSGEFDGEQLVFGSGDIDSEILFIGEAPGKDEICQGVPFVGKAGKKLEAILKDLSLTREWIYITNAVKYGLRRYDPVTGRTSNRPAENSEMIRNRPFLLEEIRCIDPAVIVTLGGVPLKTLLMDLKIKVSEHTGRCISFDDRIVWPLLHPAAMIYNPSLAETFREDIAGLKDILDGRCRRGDTVG